MPAKILALPGVRRITPTRSVVMCTVSPRSPRGGSAGQPGEVTQIETPTIDLCHAGTAMAACDHLDITEVNPGATEPDDAGAGMFSDRYSYRRSMDS